MFDTDRFVVVEIDDDHIIRPNFAPIQIDYQSRCAADVTPYRRFDDLFDHKNFRTSKYSQQSIHQDTTVFCWLVEDCFKVSIGSGSSFATGCNDAFDHHNETLAGATN